MSILIQDQFDLPMLSDQELLSYYFFAKDDWVYASSLNIVVPLGLYRKARSLYKEIAKRKLLPFLHIH